MTARPGAARRRGWLAVALGVAVGTAAPAAAARVEDVPITVRAQRFHVDQAAGILTATGDVVATVGDVVIRAGRLRLELRTNEVRADGGVSIQVGASHARGEALEYNLLTRRGRLDQAAAEFTGPPVLGTVSVRARLIEGTLGGTTTGRDITCTTCEGPEPFVQLAAREMQFFPNDRLVGRGVTVLIGGRRVLTWPYFIIYLRQHRASRILPVAGYSSLEGYYLKTFVPYSIDERHDGYLRLDLMERLGTGLAIEHTYRLARGGGVAFLYHLFDRRGGADTRVLLSHAQRVGDVGLRLYADHLTRATGPVPSTNLYVALDAAYQGPRSSTFLYQNYAGVAVPGFDSRSYLARLIHVQTLTPALWAEVTVDAIRSSGLTGVDDELFPRLALFHRGPGYTVTAVAEGRIDVDGDAFPGDVRFGIERLPEFTVSLDPQPLGRGLTYQLGASAGRFREVQPLGLVDGLRGELSAFVFGTPVLSDQARLTVRSEVRGSVYSTGAARGFISGQVDYARFLGDAWQVQVGATMQDQVGHSPFVFDQAFGRAAVLAGELTFRRPSFLATATAAYDAVGGRALPVVARAQYAPRADWVVAAALAHDPGAGQLARAELAFDVRLSPVWHVSYYGFYDGASGRVFHDRVAVTRVWQECLATALTYRGVTNEVWLEAWLVALPWARGRVGIGSQGNLLFDQPWLGRGP